MHVAVVHPRYELDALHADETTPTPSGVFRARRGPRETGADETPILEVSPLEGRAAAEVALAELAASDETRADDDPPTLELIVPARLRAERAAVLVDELLALEAEAALGEALRPRHRPSTAFDDPLLEAWLRCA
jgi:hypothetical protein